MLTTYSLSKDTLSKDLTAVSAWVYKFFVSVFFACILGSINTFLWLTIASFLAFQIAHKDLGFFWGEVVIGCAFFSAFGFTLWAVYKRPE